VAKDIKAKSIKEAMATIIARICYPVADELGEEFSNRVGFWRQNNSLKVLEKANEKLSKYTLSHENRAHPRLVHKIVEDSSWSDDDQIQDIWAGLLVSSCTGNGKDESNLIFVNILSQLTSAQVRILNYACEKAEKEVTSAGWIAAQMVTATLEQLKDITDIEDFHRLDREMDNMRAHELIEGGFPESSTTANITPTGFALQLYVRAQGYIGSPIEYFGLSDAKNSAS